MTHPLLGILCDAANGIYPADAGDVTFLPALENSLRAVVALTGHAFIATDQSPAEFSDLVLDGFGAALAPEVVLRVADGGTVGVNDVMLTAPAIGGGTSVDVTDQWDDHQRVAYAWSLRDNVTVYGDERGFFTLANGLAGRTEISIELADPAATPGLGRTLLDQARRVHDAGTPLFAAVSPGNSRSLRSFLAAGFLPIGSEVIIHPAGAE